MKAKYGAGQDSHRVVVPVMMMRNDTQMPYANTAKYLEITLDGKLRWKAHVKRKRENLGF